MARSKTRTKKKAQKPSEEFSDAIYAQVSHLVKEAEHTAESVLGQVRELFDDLTHKIADVTHPPPAVLDHVREASETSIRVIGSGFDAVRRQISERGAATPATKKKTSTKKKAGVRKKTAAKKTRARKATPRKKTTVKKRAKKAASR